ncbi:methyltransferase [Streptomyces sp. NPDC050732]|uniref:methyltransferase n=1 Tax=Streptomyces sp. NPDC050732 TaxID=3154632 RepID=UPI0034239BF7
MSAEFGGRKGSSSASAVGPRQQMFSLLMGCYAAQCIAVAADLRIADHLHEAPQRPSDLAHDTRCDARALHRLLRALAGIGVFHERDDGSFELTAAGALLRSDVPGSLQPIARLIGSDLQWPTLGKLSHTVRTGEPAFEHVFGMSMWEYLATHPDAHALFQASMSAFSTAEVRAILDHYDFSDAITVVDVAGGQGTLLAAIVDKYPHVEGILFEQPEVTREARDQFVANGLGHRCRAIAGDMFSTIPSGADCYIMKSVLHDWDDERATQLLRTCRDAMVDRATLLIITRVVRPANEPDLSKFQDLNMLINLNGAERTADEFRELLGNADLHLDEIIATPSPLSILVCTSAASGRPS